MTEKTKKKLEKGFDLTTNEKEEVLRFVKGVENAIADIETFIKGECIAYVPDKWKVEEIADDCFSDIGTGALIALQKLKKGIGDGN